MLRRRRFHFVVGLALMALASLAPRGLAKPARAAQTSDNESEAGKKPARAAPEQKIGAADKGGAEAQASDDDQASAPSAGKDDSHGDTDKKVLFAPVGVSHSGVKPPCPVQSLEEVKVLLHLRERHTVLLAREAALSQREAGLRAFEATLQEKLVHLAVAVSKIEASLSLGAAGEKAREGRLQNLTDTISTLSAKKAAPMLAQADPELVAELFRRLGPTRASSLLAVMPPAKAGKLIDYAGGSGEAKSVMSHAGNKAAPSAN